MNRLLAILTDPKLRPRLAILLGYAGMVWSALQAAASLSGGAWWSAPAVIAVLQLAAGAVQNRVPNEIWHSRVIPFANYVVGLWGFSLAPLPAHAASGVLAAVPAVLFNPFVTSFISTVCTTGLHSWSKNGLQLLQQLLQGQRAEAEHAAAA
jgi:hypothetical protein